jgi:hypothetical protein
MKVDYGSGRRCRAIKYGLVMDSLIFRGDWNDEEGEPSHTRMLESIGALLKGATLRPMEQQ